MWQIKSAEQPVPVCVVGLTFVERVQHLRRFLVVRQTVKTLGERQHALVHPVRFRVAHEEIAPYAAAHVGLGQFVTVVVLFLINQIGIVMRGRHRQCPLVHFDIGSGGQIDDAAGFRHGVIIAVSHGLDDVGIEHAFDEVAQPAALVDPFVGFRPDAEFLDIIEINRRRLLAVISQTFKVAHHLLRRREWQAITQSLGNREKVDLTAIFLGGVIAIEHTLVLAGTHEMVIVYRHVADAGIRQRRHNRGFPHPLCKPCAERQFAQRILQAGRKTGNLPDTVTRRYRGQHRFGKAGAE